jgi:hypothetical protein
VLPASFSQFVDRQQMVWNGLLKIETDGNNPPPLYSRESFLQAQLQALQMSAGSGADFSFLYNFDDRVMNCIALWLYNSQKMPEYLNHKKAFAEAICQELALLEKDATYRELALDIMRSNNSDCEDRTAMSHNLMFTLWSLYSLDPSSSLKEKLDLILRGVKTFVLRKIVGDFIEHNDPNNAENVEIYLYVEVALKEKLNLLSMIHISLFADTMGKKDYIDLEEIAQIVEKEYLHYLQQFPMIEALVKQDKEMSAKFAELENKAHVKLETLPTSPQATDMEINEKSKAINRQLDRDKENALRLWAMNFMKPHIENALGGWLNNLLRETKNRLQQVFIPNEIQNLALEEAPQELHPEETPNTSPQATSMEIDEQPKIIPKRLILGKEDILISLMMNCVMRHIENACEKWINDLNSTGNKREASDRMQQAFEDESDTCNLSNLGLSDLPGDVISKLGLLKTLDLTSNQLTVIPPEIGQLPHLGWLLLRGNPIRTLPLSLSNIPGFVAVDVDGEHFGITGGWLRSIVQDLAEYLGVSVGNSEAIERIKYVYQYDFVEEFVQEVY